MAFSIQGLLPAPFDHDNRPRANLQVAVATPGRQVLPQLLETFHSAAESSDRPVNR